MTEGSWAAAAAVGRALRERADREWEAAYARRDVRGRMRATARRQIAYAAFDMAECAPAYRARRYGDPARTLRALTRAALARSEVRS